MQKRPILCPLLPSHSFFNYFLLIFKKGTVQWLNCTYLKYKLNHYYNGGGVVYVLKRELSRSTGQYTWKGIIKRLSDVALFWIAWLFRGRKVCFRFYQEVLLCTSRWLESHTNSRLGIKTSYSPLGFYDLILYLY